MSSDNDIRKQFQKKFSDFRAEVPTDGWDRLNEALNEAKVVPLPRKNWRYIASSAAAVLLLIVGSLLYMQRQGDQVEVLLTDSAVSDSTPMLPLAPAADPVLAANEATYREVDEVVKAVSVEPDKEAGLLYLDQTSPTTRIAVNSPSSCERMTEATSELDSPNLNRISTPFAYTSREEKFFADGGEQQKHREPILLAVSGRGGLNSYQQTVNTPMTLRSAQDPPDSSEEPRKNFLTPQSAAKNVSQMEHDQPVSFGVTVSREIIDDLYIETGLVYSYLYSRVRNANANFQVQETQRLHYIGIPLNLNYNIVSLSRFNVYASVGGTIEKDLYGDFRRAGSGEAVGLNSRSEEMKIDKITQSNPQISVNAGIGVSYPIYNRLRLYGKIGGAYYFDAKNEHKTIYSDRKIVMDLNVGLRYEF